MLQFKNFRAADIMTGITTIKLLNDKTYFVNELMFFARIYFIPVFVTRLRNGNS